MNNDRLTKRTLPALALSLEKKNDWLNETERKSSKNSASHRRQPIYIRKTPIDNQFVDKLEIRTNKMRTGGHKTNLSKETKRFWGIKQNY